MPFARLNPEKPSPKTRPHHSKIHMALVDIERRLFDEAMNREASPRECLGAAREYVRLEKTRCALAAMKRRRQRPALESDPPWEDVSAPVKHYEPTHEMVDMPGFPGVKISVPIGSSATAVANFATAAVSAKPDAAQPAPVAENSASPAPPAPPPRSPASAFSPEALAGALSPF